MGVNLAYVLPAGKYQTVKEHAKRTGSSVATVRRKCERFDRDPSADMQAVFKIRGLGWLIQLHDGPVYSSPDLILCRELWGPPGNRSLTCTMPAGHGPHPTTLGHGFAGKCSGRFRIPGSGRTRDSVCSLPLGHEDECGKGI